MKHSKSEGDIIKPLSIQTNKENLLSTDEQIELYELFTNIERGWSYANRCSRNDNQWNPQGIL